MDNEKQEQAKALYFQTNLNKTQIAAALGISRRSLHYWIRRNNWERLKLASAELPSLIVENCYHLLNQLTRSYMAESRFMNPLTKDEAETLYRLTLTIQKLKNRSALNESMEMFALLQSGISKKNPELAKEIQPFIENYISSRADIHITDVMPENFTPGGYLNNEEREPYPEKRQDLDDLHAWADKGNDEAGPALPINWDLLDSADIREISADYSARFEQKVRKECATIAQEVRKECANF